METDDEAFIFDSWIQIARRPDCGMFGRGFGRAIPRPRFAAGLRALIESLLRTQRVTILCDIETPFVVYGFIVWGVVDGGELVVHWLHVKHHLSGHGLAKLLMRHVREIAGVIGNDLAVATFACVDWERLARGLGLVFDPFALMRIAA